MTYEQKVLKEFDEQFSIGVAYNSQEGQYQYATKKNKDGNCDFVYNSDIKNFILQALKEQKEQLCNLYEKRRKDALGQLLKETNRLRKLCNHDLQ